MYFGRIKEIIKIFSKLHYSFIKILDIGGGMGLFSLNFKLNFPKSNICILDQIFIKEIRDMLVNRKKVNIHECIQGNIEDKTSYENDSFDLIFALDILEHLKDPSKALNEILRIMKRKGILFISVPIEGFLLRFFRKFVGTFKNIQMNPHWNGKIKSEKEFYNCLKQKKIKIILKRNFPFKSFPKMFSYDVFYLIQKI
jgi:2-polyprenyl-3-methyl-5-hydroxy-6-metoxy-1,4-benzoquinol methylase